MEAKLNDVNTDVHKLLSHGLWTT